MPHYGKDEFFGDFIEITQFNEVVSMEVFNLPNSSMS